MALPSYEELVATKLPSYEDLTALPSYEELTAKADQPAEVQQAAEQQTMEQNAATGGAPQWAKNAADAAIQTAKGFIPSSISDVAHMLTPVLSAGEDIKKAYDIGKDVLNGSTVEEATRKHAPESFQLLDAGKTPPLSKERFQAGFDTIAQALMAAGIAKGLRAKPGAKPIEAEQVKTAEAVKPEVAPTAEVPPAPEQTTVQGQVEAPKPPEPITPGEAPSIPSAPENQMATPVSQTDVIPPESPETAGTSNRVFGETYGENVIPSGTGADTAQLLDNARASIQSGTVDPYAVLSATRQTGIANPVEYAALAAEHERLVNDAVAKQKVNDPTAPEAAKRAEDFANAIQPHKTAASDLMRLFQGELNYDLSTPFGMEQYMKAELGRAMKPSEKPMFERRALQIRQGENGVKQAIDRSDIRVRRRYAKVRDIPIEEAASRVKEWMKECQV